jgi:hypothetical protein
VSEKRDPVGARPKVDRDKILPPRLEDVEEPEPFRPPAPLPVEDEPVAGGREAPHAAKFQFILGALLAVALVGLATLGYLAADGATKADKPPWSAWQPSEDGLEGARQIADHVAARYKGSNGKQLTLVTADPFEVELDGDKIPMRVAVRERKEEGGEVNVVDGDTLLYRVCGLAARCGMGGVPSQDRALLLRRQALEIALYSFRYLDDIDQVVLFMPPAYADGRDDKTKKKVRFRLDNQSLRFDRKNLEALLELPLGRVLPGPPPPVRKAMKAPEAPLVATASEAGLFTYSMVPANGEQEVFLVLEQLTNREAVLRQQENRLEAEKLAAEGAGGEPVEPLGAE